MKVHIYIIMLSILSGCTTGPKDDYPDEKIVEQNLNTFLGRNDFAAAKSYFQPLHNKQFCYWRNSGGACYHFADAAPARFDALIKKSEECYTFTQNVIKPEYDQIEAQKIIEASRAGVCRDAVSGMKSIELNALAKKLEETIHDLPLPETENGMANPYAVALNRCNKDRAWSYAIESTPDRTITAQGGNGALLIRGQVKKSKYFPDKLACEEERILNKRAASNQCSLGYSGSGPVGTTLYRLSYMYNGDFSQIGKGEIQFVTETACRNALKYGLKHDFFLANQLVAIFGNTSSKMPKFIGTCEPYQYSMCGMTYDDGSRASDLVKTPNITMLEPPQ